MELKATDRFQSAPPGAASEAFGSLDGSESPEQILAQLDLDERIELMCADDPLVRGVLEMGRRYNGRPLVAGAVPRVGLPGIRFTDGPRGVVMYRSTAFPSSPARAATFDVDLEERIGDAIGVEARTQGANFFAGVCINLLRHPAWGRAQETYGEDSLLLGEMGAALTRGIQRHVMACVKHYALNSMENSRFWVDVRVDERDLREVYLPHFKRVVDEGVAGVMSAYNKVNGTWCGHHRHLLRDILKGEWGFEGVVMSDFLFGIRGAVGAIEGGLDVEMPQRGWYRRLHRLVRRGRVPAALVDDAAARIVGTQVRFAGVGEPERYQPEAVASVEHRALAQEAATRGLVLLRNDPPGRDSTPSDRPGLLPFDPGRITSLAVIGNLATLPNLGDLGSSQVYPPEVVTILEALTERCVADGIDLRYDDGDDHNRAAAIAGGCTAAVVVAGATHDDEGEWIGRSGGDRASLRLPGRQGDLVRTVASANPATTLVLIGGSVFVTDDVDGDVPAVMMAWYPGMEGGTAITDVLFGRAEPAGRLPLTWPSTTTELPPFRRFARRIEYGPLHGYRMMEATRQQPAYWFGHGLSYTHFAWSEPEVIAAEPREDGSVSVRMLITVRNTGSRPGTEIIQVYAPKVLGSHRDALRTLCGWTVLRNVEPTATATASLEFVVPRDCEQVFIAPSADPAGAIAIELPPTKAGRVW